MAIASRVSKLESETNRLHQKITEKDHLIFQLEDKVMKLEQGFQESDSRLRLVVEDNAKLSKERDSLAITVKRLTRDLSKLETFKRQLMQSLNDDNTSPAESVDIGTIDKPVYKAYSVKDDKETGNPTEDVSRHVGQKFSMTPYISPKLTPAETPNVISKGASPRGYSTAGSPNMTSGPTSPTKTQYEGRIAYSPWYSSSQQSSAATSPRRGRSISASTPRVDGKEFFRQARSRLSYEQFSAFLADIKEFNAQKQSREETLRKAEEIFGTENRDLYLSFQGLLNRNSHS
ncbi:interactor of constitutive active ROPs protein [Thalictrum thalictroides]|uniref:Interactor of constitutive active ROPs protein n=1 Tax=Thalictrum thalictroides TaxID=46969 RepID=A0A7J6XG13_THATH|nr:interactor of constitutive active ROPs protein [Thalictrum thalictroides]